MGRRRKDVEITKQELFKLKELLDKFCKQTGYSSYSFEKMVDSTLDALYGVSK